MRCEVDVRPSIEAESVVGSSSSRGRTLMRKYFCALLLLFPIVGAAQEYRSALVDSKARARYSAIEFMSAAEGRALAEPPDGGPAETPQTEMLRLVVYRSEASQSVVVETVTTGLEGCCSKVARTQMIDLEGFARHFGFAGEPGQFSFAGWTSADSFRFDYDGKPFVARVSAREVRFDRVPAR